MHVSCAKKQIIESLIVLFSHTGDATLDGVAGKLIKEELIFAPM